MAGDAIKLTCAVRSALKVPENGAVPELKAGLVMSELVRVFANPNIELPPLSAIKFVI